MASLDSAMDLPDPETDSEPGPLEPGISRTDEFTVEGALVTDVGGTLGANVLSTPGMIAMMERTSSVLVYERLPEGSATVGFEVEVKEGDRTLGVGTHERRLVDVGKVGEVSGG